MAAHRRRSGRVAARPAPGVLLASADLGPRARALRLRRFVNIQPILNYGDLQPGGRATKAVRATIAKLGLTPDKGVTGAPDRLGAAVR